MGTRGAYGFRTGRTDKVSYNHGDSYPSWLGKEILDFIRKETLASLTEKANRITLVDQDKKPTKAQINACSNWANTNVGNQKIEDWYCLLRDAQGNLDAFNEGLDFMIDSKSFLLDSLFCEYAYIINVSTQELEFYRGFNKSKKTNKGRYASKTLDERGGYYGVTLVEKYPLSDIIGKGPEISKQISQMMEDSVKVLEDREERKSMKSVY